MTARSDTKKVRARHLPSYYGTHPLDGHTVATWVAEARAGWPKVPVPADPVSAAERVMKAHASADVQWEEIK